MSLWKLLVVVAVPFLLLGLVSCSTPEPPKPSSEPSSQPSSEPVADLVCNIGENVDGKWRRLSCAEINAQTDCPRCNG